MDEEQKKNSADKPKARHCAAGLLKAARLTEAPVSINSLANQIKRDFDIVVSPAPTGLFRGKGDAAIQRRDNVIFIVYDDSKPVVRKRFSVAHEIGHLYLGHLNGCSSIDLNSEDFDEIEANAFAANILMPKKFLQADITTGLGANELIKKYRVSEESLWYQLTDAGLINMLYKHSKG